MNMKKYNTGARIKLGNQQAEYVRQYLNNRFNVQLDDYSGLTRDKQNGEDFGCENFSFQCKVRDKYDDIIFETDKFIPNGDGTFERTPGRDARTLANYYIVKPKNQNKFCVIPTKNVKNIIKNTIKLLNKPIGEAIAINNVKCRLITYTNEEITEFWKKARDTYNKSIVLFEKDGLQITFKIEEGDRKPYGKILFYVPFQLVEGSIINLKEGEIYTESSTWNNIKEKEDINEYLI